LKYNNIHEKISQFLLANSRAIFSKYSAKSENNTKKPDDTRAFFQRLEIGLDSL
jgi:uncharacterized protein (DUF39 family)